MEPAWLLVETAVTPVTPITLVLKLAPLSPSAPVDLAQIRNLSTEIGVARFSTLKLRLLCGDSGDSGDRYRQLEVAYLSLYDSSLRSIKISPAQTPLLFV